MAKFDVEHESVNRFYVWWRLIPLKFKNSKGTPKWFNSKKMTNVHTLLAYIMSFCRFFGSRNTILKLWTSVSVHGWSYMAKLRNIDVKWCNFAKKWFILIYYRFITRLCNTSFLKKKRFLVRRHIWNSLHQFLYMGRGKWQKHR